MTRRPRRSLAELGSHYVYYSRGSEETIIGPRMYQKESRDDVSWQDALTRLEQETDSSRAPFSAYTYILRGCSRPSASRRQGHCAHSLVIKHGLEQDHYLSNLLLLLYGNRGSLAELFSLFVTSCHVRNVFSCAILIKACIQYGHRQMAMQLFDQMHVEGIIPDAATFVTMLSACSSAESLAQCIKIHVRLLYIGSEITNAISDTALMNAYNTCGNLEQARKVFDNMGVRNVVSWTAMIAAYSGRGYGRDSLMLFQEMQDSGVVPNNVTYLSLVNACACDGACMEGKLLHTCIMEKDFHADTTLVNALVTMYGVCGCLREASMLFDKMVNRDVVSWTALITANVRHNSCWKAHQHFQQMQMEGFPPDRVTYVSMLDACSQEAALMEGQKMHLYIECSKLVVDVVVGTSLVTLYGKCGQPHLARTIFDHMSVRNVLTWNALVASYCQHGDVGKALQTMERMEGAGVAPDEATFSSILSVCAHAGLVDEAFKLALKMHFHYHIQPKVEHCNCIIGLLGRVGLVKDGEDLMKSLPVQPIASSWVALLGACKTHVDVGGGKHAAEHVFEINSERESPFILVSQLLYQHDCLEAQGSSR